MAKGDQITALIRAFKENDHERFMATANQMAAHEEKLGHAAIAYEIRQILMSAQKAHTSPKVHSFFSTKVPELDNFAITSHPEERLGALTIPTDLRKKLEKILLEYRKKAKLYAHDLQPKRRLLFYGPPGTGKTLTARVIAGELHLPLFTILMDRLITKFMGETSARLRQIFSLMEQEKGIYLFDEFDAIGGNRSQENEVGEMRRVVNTFLQMLDKDTSDSIIIAATNEIGILDRALFRRFDDILPYPMPDRNLIYNLLCNKLGSFWDNSLGSTEIVEIAYGLSQAEITGACLDAKKNAILDDKNFILSDNLVECIQSRKAKYENWRL